MASAFIGCRATRAPSVSSGINSVSGFYGGPWIQHKCFTRSSIIHCFDGGKIMPLAPNLPLCLVRFCLRDCEGIWFTLF